MNRNPRGLPADILEHSISDKETVLPHKYAISAIDHLGAAGHLVIASVVEIDLR